MKLKLLLTIVLLFTAQFSIAQQDQQPPSQPPPNQQARFAAGTMLRVELVKSIDAKKAKAGDLVIAKTREDILAGGNVVAPRGTRISGHVVAATPHHGDTPSRLEIALDQIAMRPGNEVPMKAVIQALSKPAPPPPAAGDYGSPGRPTGQGTMNGPMGSSGRMGGGSPPAASTPTNGGIGDTGGMPSGASAANAPLPTNAQGAIGMSDVTLNADQQGNSTLTSEKHNIKLEEGTQMLIRVTD
jgi:hypothetical protein